MRGKERRAENRKRRGGITPAHAGKSFDPKLARLCPTGSPPRMRGEVRAPPGHFFMTRITPAHAGRSWQLYHKTHQFQDHPRACGEKKYAVMCKNVAGGSPPRMRGEDSLESKNIDPVGITPAHAGRRIFWKAGSTKERDHPRACGEKAFDFAFVETHFRITPAHAGRRTKDIRPCAAGEDHPRACGEKTHC